MAKRNDWKRVFTPEDAGPEHVVGPAFEDRHEHRRDVCRRVLQDPRQV
jgi:hypothetical protein